MLSSGRMKKGPLGVICPLLHDARFGPSPGWSDKRLPTPEYKSCYLDHPPMLSIPSFLFSLTRLISLPVELGGFAQSVELRAWMPSGLVCVCLILIQWNTAKPDRNLRPPCCVGRAACL